ncbi:nucleotide exchange factor GrpE [Phytoactinopolyspora alkaliphila]|uniref:Protein GrpE n=1 Tax=Phytoactinopolyspora alkaliphila TaxID=1783498 RepID=A0A6N9YLI1_9ACTN|nr:nucleotide exchange factor GrpE [Phytoactinopolyspora alkaliphila]
MDPQTGQRREPDDVPEPEPPLAHAAAAAPEDYAPSGSGDDAELTQARAEAAERLDDLRRVQAEYTNYRRRVERDREAVREAARVEVLSGMLSVLDDIGRAREHGDLTGAFRAVGEALEAAVTKAGLEQYGEVGDEFDPTVHEALMHGYADDITVPTCTQILQPGYRVGERIVRPARVAVAEPTEALGQADSDAGAGNAGDAAEPSSEEE